MLRHQHIAPLFMSILAEFAGTWMVIAVLAFPDTIASALYVHFFAMIGVLTSLGQWRFDDSMDDGWTRRRQTALETSLRGQRLTSVVQQVWILSHSWRGVCPMSEHGQYFLQESESEGAEVPRDLTLARGRSRLRALLRRWEGGERSYTSSSWLMERRRFLPCEGRDSSLETERALVLSTRYPQPSAVLTCQVANTHNLVVWVHRRHKCRLRITA